MNDEQIKDSLRNLAATAPRTDIWPRISGQVEQQKPHRALWPHLRLRPLLVGLDALAIAALLFIMLGPAGLKGNLATGVVVGSVPANTPTPCVIGYPIEESAVGCPDAYSTQQATTSPASQQSDVTPTWSLYPVPHTYTLADFAQIMANEPNFRLPTALPSGYKLGDISMPMVSYAISGTSTVTVTEELSRYGWYIEYQKNTPGQDQQIMRLHVFSRVEVVRAGDELNRPVTVPNPLAAIGDPNYKASGGYMSDSDRLAARYRRTDRIIELYHDVRLGPSQDRYAFVYFANQDAQYPLTQVSIFAPENVSDAELLKMADSIERVDPQRLADYQNGRSPAATPVADSTNQSPASPETWATLRQRPLALPSLAPGAGCPTSTGKQVSPDFGLALGDGPVYPVGFGASGSASYQGSRVAGGWYFLKVVWAGDPSYKGPILVRGRQIDGPNELRFSDGDNPPTELQLDTSAGGWTSSGWNNWVDYTRVRTSGCYAYQIDGLGFSKAITFKVTDKLPPPKVLTRKARTAWGQQVVRAKGKKPPAGVGGEISKRQSCSSGRFMLRDWGGITAGQYLSPKPPLGAFCFLLMPHA